MKKHVIWLSALQRAELCLMARSGRASARQVLRAKILMKADAGGEAATDQEIAESLAVGVATVERVRARFMKEGQAALNRRPSRRVQRSDGSTAKPRHNWSCWPVLSRPMAATTGRSTCWPTAW